MDFKTHYLEIDMEGRERLAKRIDSSVPYLSQLAYGHRVASRKLAEKIERATGGKVTASEMLFPSSRNFGPAPAAERAA